jgi:uncharacterized membrane protein
MKPDSSTLRRTIAKAVSWETISNLICLGLAWAWFGNFGGCAAFTLVCFLVKLALFVPHDRVWHQIPYGKKAPQ